MNRDLYTEEFRNFKFLKSDPALVNHFKGVSSRINSIQPWNSELDPSFKWGGRVEFLEQLFDLKDDNLYIVEPCTTAAIKYSKLEEYEDARLHVIENPLIYSGNPLINSNITVSTENDIPIIEDRVNSDNYYISSRIMLTFINVPSSDHFKWKTIAIKETPLVYQSAETYLALFYDPVWAEKYRSAVSKFVKDYFGAVSTIAARL